MTYYQNYQSRGPFIWALCRFHEPFRKSITTAARAAPQAPPRAQQLAQPAQQHAARGSPPQQAQQRQAQPQLEQQQHEVQQEQQQQQQPSEVQGRDGVAGEVEQATGALIGPGSGQWGSQGGAVAVGGSSGGAGLTFDYDLGEEEDEADDWDS